MRAACILTQLRACVCTCSLLSGAEPLTPLSALEFMRGTVAARQMMAWSSGRPGMRLEDVPATIGKQPFSRCMRSTYDTTTWR